ncbi:hypothetical protein [Planomonospora venezuelensis]|uniref:Uncharacterized protein n=1 Tax=Planomonospora venezuelensis TaxID=1999 RepID=A0A841D7D4_PLAVE|nr:hypothetical protein [Planomonospora venezuelensis]MBB5964823.1 hypothetical protein [Planomonospora venezuelensis]GIM99310.1 hypothetical protein Pve01_09690 [Planomonospora venezuelensis]
MRVPRATPQARRPAQVGAAQAGAARTAAVPAARPVPVGDAPAARPATAGTGVAGAARAQSPAVRRGAAAPRRRGRAPRAPFVLLVVGLLCGGLITLLLLNTVLAEGSFKENDLRNANKALMQQKEERKNENARKQMPDEIAKGVVDQKPDWDSVHALDPDGQAQGRGAGTGR